MNLLAKTTRYFVFFSLIVFTAAALIYFYVLRAHLYKQADSNLLIEMGIIKEQLQHAADTIPDFNSDYRGQIEVRLYDHPVKHALSIYDTTIVSGNNAEEVSCRRLLYSDNTRKGKGYSISIFHAMQEKKELLEAITYSSLFLVVSLFLFTIILNYWISRRLWLPFNDTLKKINNVDIGSDTPLSLSHSDIREFNQLNSVIEGMVDKMRKDYVNVKEFIHYASHEIQTPLAIIRAKLEIMMQSEELSKEQVMTMHQLQEATSKLSRINQGLLMMSKIDNQEYTLCQEVSFKEIIENYLGNMEELIQMKNIRIDKEYHSDLKLHMHPALAEILVTNLISNAIKHNNEKGFISFYLDGSTFRITNSGRPLHTDPSELFEKFRKESRNPESLGLGLAIVKKIVTFYNLQINYVCNEGVHTITLTAPFTS